MNRKVSEKSIENAVVECAKRNGILVMKQNYMGRNGFPDRAFYFEGGLLGQVEFKRPGQLPTTLQANTILQLRARGFDVQVIDNVEDGIAYIKDRHSCACSDDPEAYFDTKFSTATIKVLRKVLPSGAARR